LTGNAHPVLLKNYAGPGDKDGTPTTRPSDFPEADSWPASMRVCPGTEPAVLGITYEMAISRYVSEGLVAEWLEILLAPASADPD
jgi:hypothetical protein